MPERFTAAQVAAAITETRGMLFLAAKRLGCTYHTVRNYVERYPSVAAAKEACRGEMIDTCELKLWQSIQNGEAWGISLALRTLGKDRGYGDSVEVSGDLRVVRLPHKAPSAEAWQAQQEEQEN